MIRPGRRVIFLGKGIKAVAPRGSAGVTYLFQDLFTTPENSPLASPRTAEPGPGTATFSVNTSADIIDGHLQTKTGGTTSYYYYSSYVQPTSLNGFATWCEHLANVPGSTVITEILYSRVVSKIHNRFYLANTSYRIYEGSNYIGNTGIRPVLSKNCSLFTVLLGSGRSAFVTRDCSTKETILVHIGNMDDTTLGNNNFYKSFSGLNGRSTKTSGLCMAEWGAPWTTPYGLASTHLSGVRNTSDTFEHAANAIIEFWVDTLPSSGEIEMRFRIQDASNYWKVTIDSAGIRKIVEVVAGAPTVRATATTPVTNGQFLTIRTYDAAICVSMQSYSTLYYLTATNFQTETDGGLFSVGTGGQVSNIVVTPVAVTASALAVLESFIQSDA